MAFGGALDGLSGDCLICSGASSAVLAPGL